MSGPSAEFVDGYNDALNDVEAVVLRYIEKLRATYGAPVKSGGAPGELVSNPVTGESLGYRRKGDHE